MRSLQDSNGLSSAVEDDASVLRSTYQREYTGVLGPAALNARVKTSRFLPCGRPYLDSTYSSDFAQPHQQNPRRSIPSGSASGSRKNNPHPHNLVQAFSHPQREYFVWSHYRKLPPVTQRSDGLRGPSSDELLRQVCLDKTRTVYQHDYIPPAQDGASSTAGGVPMLSQNTDPIDQRR